MATRRRKAQTADLFTPSESEGAVEPPKYDPLPSVWYGTDAELLEKMLDFYPRQQPERILDATVNRGRFWEGSSRPVTGLDQTAAEQHLSQGLEDRDSEEHAKHGHSEPAAEPAQDGAGER